MPKTFSHINLIQSKAKGSAQLAAVEQSLRKSALISILIFIFLGVTVASAYFFFTMSKNTVEQKRKELLTQINAAKNKEGLLISIKERTSIVSRVMEIQRPWATVFDTIGTIVAPTILTTLSADEHSKITFSLTVSSLDDVLAPIDQLIALTKDGKIQNPQLVSLQFAKDGSVLITISFLAVFNSI